MQERGKVIKGVESMSQTLNFQSLYKVQQNVVYFRYFKLLVLLDQIN